MKRRSSADLLVTAALLACVFGACGESGTGPDPVERSEVVGSYEATTFRTTEDGSTTDLLAQGASLDFSLRSDGTTDGRLFVPGGAEGGGDLDASMVGTWSFDTSGDTVRLDQDADTFVRDMPFRAERASGGVRLVGDETFGGVRVEVVMSRP